MFATRSIILKWTVADEDRWKALQTKTEADSMAEVVGSALQIYEWLVNVAGQEAKVVIQRTDGITEIVPLFK
jgi:hypothetical protein